MRVRVAVALGAICAVAGGAHAGPADVVAVQARCRPAPELSPASSCRFAVTVSHADTGWQHYANRFEIVTPDGEVIGRRVLRHPHVDEQPFTRTLERVRVAHEVREVVVRAGDLLHGLGGASKTVLVPHAKRETRPRPDVQP